MQNILITVSSNRMVRTYLDTYLFYDLVKTDNHFIVISHQKNISSFFKDYENVEAVPLIRNIKTNYFKRIIRTFWDCSWKLKRFPIEDFFFTTGKRDNSFYLKKTIIIILSILFMPLYNLIKKNIWYSKEYADFLRENKIDRVILTSCSLYEERIIGVTANKLGIPIVVGCDGWDTYYTHNLFIDYAYAMVWGKPMEEFLKKQLYYNFKKVIFIGIPYKKSLLSSKLSKFEIKSKYGIKKDDKVILMFSSGKYTSGEGERKTVENIIKAIENGKLVNVKLILRLMPRVVLDDWAQYYIDKYSNNDNIILQIADSSYAETNINSDINSNNFKEVGELYKIADIMINILSMSLLECNLTNSNCKLILCNYDKKIYPTKYMSKSELFKKVVDSNLIEVKDVNKIVTVLSNLLKNLDENSKCSLAREWDFKEDNVINKILGENDATKNKM